jgi:hypothetical protein
MHKKFDDGEDVRQPTIYEKRKKINVIDCALYMGASQDCALLKFFKVLQSLPLKEFLKTIQAYL